MPAICVCRAVASLPILIKGLCLEILTRCTISRFLCTHTPVRAASYRSCIELTLEDQRTLIVTPDHRLLALINGTHYATSVFVYSIIYTTLGV
jgi:hypothetical protein